MKLRTAVATAALILIPMVTIAAPPGLEHGEPEARVERLTERLDLSVEQAEAIGAIIAEADTEGRAVRDSMEALMGELREAREAGDERAMKRILGSIDDLKEEGHDLRVATMDRLRDEMTVTQQAKFVELEVERHERTRRLHEGMRKRFAEEGR